MSISVLGAGAFGTALAISLAKARPDVTLWGRDADMMREMQQQHQNKARLPGIALPDSLKLTSDLSDLTADTMLLVVPAQTLGTFVQEHADHLRGKTLVVCSKGVDLTTGMGPTKAITTAIGNARVAILTGPSFAVDIANGLPTALTLAVDGDATQLRDTLSTGNIRLYSTVDRLGAELGGALKNVMAIACGAAIGAGLGESARAALMTRGFAEMRRFAVSQGAQSATLAGLSGFGDLVLTCTSDKSRNYATGLALGAGRDIPKGKTVEGIATAKAVAKIAKRADMDLPITTTVCALVDGEYSVNEALTELLSRPLKEE